MSWAASPPRYRQHVMLCSRRAWCTQPSVARWPLPCRTSLVGCGLTRQPDREFSRAQGLRLAAVHRGRGGAGHAGTRARRQAPARSIGVIKSKGDDRLGAAAPVRCAAWSARLRKSSHVIAAGSGASSPRPRVLPAHSGTYHPSAWVSGLPIVMLTTTELAAASHVPSQYWGSRRRSPGRDRVQLRAPAAPGLVLQPAGAPAGGDQLGGRHRRNACPRADR